MEGIEHHPKTKGEILNIKILVLQQNFHKFTFKLQENPQNIF